MKNLELKAYVTNLGKYVEGTLQGEYVDLPVAKDELKKVYDRIGINERYEETFITDYDGNYPDALYHNLGEYESIDTLNKIALMFEKINEKGEDAIEQFSALCEDGYDVFDAGANVINDGLAYMPNVTDYSDLGGYYVDAFGGIEALPKETIEGYIDYEALGRDVEIEYYQDEDMPETAGEYWCNDADATHKQIGEAVIDELGIEGINNADFYFDFEQYGKDIYLEGNYIFTDSGCIDLQDFDGKLGKDFQSDLKDELDEMNNNAPEQEEPSFDDDDER